ncbi:unnamed protein product [Callosobruchus maculatus]|uniref:Uncharacterized protein n=1 Tax=Callosobruchus maculatus TaxID=64391 RepID=A0A653CC46_CALMS|nr:unnamed protein product [Callosobruchus maculatus]
MFTEIPVPTTLRTTTNPDVSDHKKDTSFGSHLVNNVDSGSKVPEYDYDSVGGEYTLPSNGPPPIREPPGASSGSNSSTSSLFLSAIVYVTTFLSISR